MRHLIFLFTFILSSMPVLASSFSFMHLDTSNGLPNLQVEAIAQDWDGYIWIGTRNGLAKYDGYNVQVYNHTKGQQHSLVHNFVHGLFVDSQGRLWIGTENGVSRYRPETEISRAIAQVLPSAGTAASLQAPTGYSCMTARWTRLWFIRL